jgi:hypothetical protein
MADTSFDKDGVDKAADAIGKIMDTRRADFQALVQQWPNAGQFPTAQWLERIVDDRRNGLVEHAQRLNEIFEEMQTKLRSVANDLDQTDADNAAATNDVSDMKSQIDALVLKYDKNTETQQDNYADGGKDGKVNAGDGDGYDDNLLKPVTPSTGAGPDPGTDDASSGDSGDSSDSGGDLSGTTGGGGSQQLK